MNPFVGKYLETNKIIEVLREPGSNKEELSAEKCALEPTTKRCCGNQDIKRQSGQEKG